MKNKTTAALLAFFLGGFGAHLFYLEKSNRGWFYLLLLATAFTTMVYREVLIASVIIFVLGLIALLDFIFLVTMSNYKFNEEYNNGIGNEPIVDNVTALKKLFELKQLGAITEEEYNKKKLEYLK